jgi:dCMP deaminase
MGSNSMITGKSFLRIAREVAGSSHCVSEQVGSAIVKDGRVIVMGYNGTAEGYTNCDDMWEHSGPEHSAWSQDHEVHAEMNAIMYAAKKGIAIEGSEIYSTLSPCRQCLKHMQVVGITHVYFEDLYRKTSEAQHRLDLEFCADLGIGLTQMSSEK